MPAHVIPPVNAAAIASAGARFGITEAMLIYSSVPEVPPAPGYNPATTYAKDTEISVGTVGGPIAVWRSKQDGNLGHALENGAWWEFAGNTYAAWNAAQAYTKEQLVLRPNTHMVYKRVTDGTTPEEPEKDVKGVNWTPYAVTNRWAMFDMLSGTPTRAPGPITIKIKPGRVTALALIGVSDGTADLQMVDGSATVWDPPAIALDTTVVSNWEEYFFEPFALVGNIVRFDVPTYAEGVITITIQAGQDFSLQWLVIGTSQQIGITETGPDIRDRSGAVINRDSFNELQSVQQQNPITEISQQLWLEKHLVMRARDALRLANSCPCVFVGLQNQQDVYSDLLTLIGLNMDSSIRPLGDVGSTINLKVESV